jgi:hypothetical protein
MSDSEESRGALDPEPWANDERLQDVLKKSAVIRAIKLIHKLADALEKAPIAPMPKSESIPLLWEKAKDLKEQNFNDLINACHEHDAYRQCDEKTKEENRHREKCAREDEEYLKKQQREKRPAEEMEEEEEEAIPLSRERKRTASDIFNVLQDEGTCANSNSNCMTLWPLLRTHALCYCYGSNNCARFVGAYTDAHAIENLAARTLWIRMLSIILPCKIVAATHNCN